MRGARHASDGVDIHRRIVPAQHSETFLARDPLQDAFGDQAMRRLHRQKYHAHAVLARRRQREAQLFTLAREEFVRDLDQDAGAIASFRIAAAGAAVREIDQDLQPFENNLVRLLALGVDHKADTAGVVLVSGVVQTLRFRKSDHA